MEGALHYTFQFVETKQVLGAAESRVAVPHKSLRHNVLKMRPTYTMHGA